MRVHSAKAAAETAILTVVPGNMCSCRKTPFISHLLCLSADTQLQSLEQCMPQSAKTL